MLIPYSTDAPIYHWPIATGAMIAANILAYAGMIGLASSMDEESFERLITECILLYGHGLRPWQWITSNFVHGGLMHLLGNMFCLWGFGLVVEGKVGWWRFLLIYLGIGAIQCALEQSLMFFSEGASYGASSIVYGLLAIGMVWAPQNEMSCILILFRIFAFDVTLYTLAGIAMIVEIATGVLGGLAMSSQVLHLMGAGVGFTVGVAMLKQGWVDCEGWDLFRVWKGEEHAQREEETAAAQQLLQRAHFQRMNQLAGSAPTPTAAAMVAPQPVSFDPDSLFAASPLESSSMGPTDQALFEPTLAEQAAAALAAGDPEQAWGLYQKDAALTGQPVAERDLLQTIAAFHQQRKWSQSVPVMIEYFRRYRTRRVRVGLKLAQILLEVEKQPARAAQVLTRLEQLPMEPKESELLAQLKSRL